LTVVEAVQGRPVRCSYHSANASVVACSRCARPLCPACDHRIRGFPYCQDCIVAGVELLQQRPALVEAPQHVRRKTSQWIALLLSFIFPGLGAAYNGQTSKAVVHFAIFASCLQMSSVTNTPAFFILAAVGTWLFAAVDAFRTAQLIRAGLAPDAESDPITRRLYGHPAAWAVLLITLGTLFLLNTMFGVKLPVRQLLPAALVLLGAYMLFDFLRRGRAAREPDFERTPASSAVGGATLDMTAFRAGELAAQQPFPARERNDWPPRA
jgi:TM2 domain-containing membrane protein YozV